MAARFHYRTILIATDFSDPAHAAVERGVDLAIRLDARIELVFVTPQLAPALPFHRRNRRVVKELQREEKTEAQQALATLAEAVGVEVRTRVLVGRPSTEILDHARRVRASLIVMGQRGISTTERWLIGSVTERVLRKSTVPVVVVPTAARGRR